MTVIGHGALESFWRKHGLAKGPLSRWYSITQLQKWRNLADVKRTFPSADLVGGCVVFNIGGNNYRLITRIDYEIEVVDVRFILTHKEYDRNTWKKDC